MLGARSEVKGRMFWKLKRLRSDMRDVMGVQPMVLECLNGPYATTFQSPANTSLTSSPS